MHHEYCWHITNRSTARPPSHLRLFFVSFLLFFFCYSFATIFYFIYSTPTNKSLPIARRKRRHHRRNVHKIYQHYRIVDDRVLVQW